MLVSLCMASHTNFAVSIVPEGVNIAVLVQLATNWSSYMSGDAGSGEGSWQCQGPV